MYVKSGSKMQRAGPLESTDTHHLQCSEFQDGATYWDTLEKEVSRSAAALSAES